MSYQKDCKVTSKTSTTPTMYTCSILNANFYRNWVTNNPQQDVQLNDNFGGRNYDAVGWIASYADSTYTASKVIAPVLGKPVLFQPITKAYLEKKTADAKAVFDVAAKKVADTVKI